MIYDLWEAATGHRLIQQQLFSASVAWRPISPTGWLENASIFATTIGPKSNEYEKADHNIDLQTPH